MVTGCALNGARLLLINCDAAKPLNGEQQLLHYIILTFRHFGLHQQYSTVLMRHYFEIVIMNILY